MSEMECEWARVKRGVHLANTVSSTDEQAEDFRGALREAMRGSVERCAKARRRAREAEEPLDTRDEAIVACTRFTDALPLAHYDRVLHLVPRLVNVVTVSAPCVTLATHRY